jgi:hypothetical protein
LARARTSRIESRSPGEPYCQRVSGLGARISGECEAHDAGSPGSGVADLQYRIPPSTDAADNSKSAKVVSLRRDAQTFVNGRMETTFRSCLLEDNAGYFVRTIKQASDFSKFTALNEPACLGRRATGKAW